MKIKNILIIDDYEFQSLVIEAVLESSFRYEYVCTQFTNPLEAIKDFKINNYDLVITDYEMPQLKGDEVCLKLREINSSIKIMVMSAWFDSVTTSIGTILEDVISKAKPDAVMPKPFTDDFTEIIDKLMV